MCLSDTCSAAVSAPFTDKPLAWVCAMALATALHASVIKPSPKKYSSNCVAAG